MPNLFPVNYNEESIGEELLAAETPIGYKESVDFDGGDIVRNSQNKAVMANGAKAWEQWCIKCLQTERFKYAAYSSDYGIETDEILNAETRELAESIATRQITEALSCDSYKRLEYIDSIIYEWGNDSLSARITAVGIDDVTIDFTTKLGGTAYG